MKKEEAKTKIEEGLKQMSCTDIIFADSEENLIVVTFNCRELTSFVTIIRGWFSSGVHLDPSKNRQYKLDFKNL
jgi:hypothetical protein